MSNLVDEMIEHTIESEGGYQDDPDDWINVLDGEMVGTKYGISPPTLKRHLRRNPTREEMENLTEDVAFEIYKHNYYFRPKIDRLPEEIQANVFDAGVMSGQKRAILILQKALNDVGCDPNGIDGGVGQGTVGACEQYMQNHNYPINEMYCDARIAFYERLCEKKPKLNKFIKGWTNRVNRFRG